MTLPEMVEKMPPSPPSSTPPSKIRSQIDENLKRIYDDITKEEVPERFRALLDSLREKTAGAQGSAANGKATAMAPAATTVTKGRSE